MTIEGFLDLASIAANVGCVVCIFSALVVGRHSTYPKAVKAVHLTVIGFWLAVTAFVTDVAFFVYYWTRRQALLLHRAGGEGGS